VVECQLPKLDVAGSTPAARSIKSSNQISHLPEKHRKPLKTALSRARFQSRFQSLQHMP